jgi:hypothetical protein
MRHAWHRLLFCLSLLLPLLSTTACGDGDIRRGCKNYCRCHKGKRSVSACEARCTDKLRALKKRDRPRERQIADCLAAKGKRSCAELAACAHDVLK